MNVNVRRAIMGIVILIVFASGAVLGHRLTLGRMMEHLTHETRGNLANRVETLARLRTGDLDGGIELLEKSIDIAIETLPQGRPVSELSEAVRFSLMTAKVYREVYPPDDPASPVVDVLSELPLPDVKYCSPALQKLLVHAQAGETEPL